MVSSCLAVAKESEEQFGRGFQWLLDSGLDNSVDNGISLFEFVRERLCCGRIRCLFMQHEACVVIGLVDSRRG